MTSMSKNEEAKAQMEEHLQFVAREIGRDWRKLGRELKISHAVIEGIEEEHTTEEERAYQVLVKWSQDKGFSGATKNILIKALKDIGKTSIAEGIEYKNGNTGHHKPPQQLMIDAIPHDEPHTSTEERRKSPSPTWNHIIEKFGKTIKEIYQSCRDNLTTSTDCLTLVNKLKQALHVKDLSEILGHLIESNGYVSCDRMELLQKSCETLLQQTDKTISFILQTLTYRGQPNPKEASQRKGRPVSEILPQRSSEVELQPPQQLMIDANPHDEPHTSTEERRKSPSPTWNHIIEKFGKTVKEMYQNCTDNLTTSTDCHTLVNKLKQAQHVKDLSEIFAHLIESNGYISCDRMELLQKSCETLLQQTDETISFILQTLIYREQPKPKNASQRKERPVSTRGIIVPQLSNEVELQTSESIPNHDEINADNPADAIYDTKL